MKSRKISLGIIKPISSSNIIERSTRILLNDNENVDSIFVSINEKKNQIESEKKFFENNQSIQEINQNNKPIQITHYKLLKKKIITNEIINTIKSLNVSTPTVIYIFNNNINNIGLDSNFEVFDFYYNPNIINDIKLENLNSKKYLLFTELLNSSPFLEYLKDILELIYYCNEKHFELCNDLIIESNNEYEHIVFYRNLLPDIDEIFDMIIKYSQKMMNRKVLNSSNEYLWLEVYLVFKYIHKYLNNKRINDQTSNDDSEQLGNELFNEIIKSDCKRNKFAFRSYISNIITEIIKHISPTSLFIYNLEKNYINSLNNHYHKILQDFDLDFQYSGERWNLLQTFNYSKLDNINKFYNNKLFDYFENSIINTSFIKHTKIINHEEPNYYRMKHGTISLKSKEKIENEREKIENKKELIQDKEFEEYMKTNEKILTKYYNHDNETNNNNESKETNNNNYELTIDLDGIPIIKNSTEKLIKLPINSYSNKKYFLLNFKFNKLINHTFEVTVIINFKNFRVNNNY